MRPTPVIVRRLGQPIGIMADIMGLPRRPMIPGHHPIEQDGGFIEIGNPHRLLHPEQPAGDFLADLGMVGHALDGAAAADEAGAAP